MIKIYDYNKLSIPQIFNRSAESSANAERIVAEIIANVQKYGDKALLEYTLTFDKAALADLLVSDAEIEDAYNNCDKYFIETLTEAKNNIAKYHGKQVRNGFKIDEDNGIVLGQKITPIDKVGVYVPGGTASYPSTVLMNIVPAKIAGVNQIIMVTPPNKEGKIAKEILAAAKIAGATAIYKVGGAQAIAALAYGTESVPKVDKIVGPGNIFVATAKKQVFGIVNIDMIAGPSEILVIADASANYKYVAADLLSQAEHDKLASAILITDSAKLALLVQTECENQLKMLPRAVIARTSIDDNGKIIVVKSIDEGIKISNLIAPEHLELAVEQPFRYLDAVKNAGSIFLGKYTPEALGDYFAGTNHTLPTGGTARFSSPLSVDDFIKKSSYIYYDKSALAQCKDRIVDFAQREGLFAHGKSVSIRYEDDKE